MKRLLGVWLAGVALLGVELTALYLAREHLPVLPAAAADLDPAAASATAEP